MRYLYTAQDNVLFAYAPGRRDYFTAGDDQLWAHESHGWLIEAKSGQTLAHRTGDTYYSALDGERLYRVSTDRDPVSADPALDPVTSSRPRRAPARVARTRH